jgi:ketosteroid isomerase-like protein
MSQINNEVIKEAIRDLVRKLFQAENHPGDKDTAADILATDYLPIIRAKGQVDDSRKDTLEKIANGSPLFVRHANQAVIEVALFLDNQVAIARTLLPTTDSRETPPVEAAYRNTHVFLKRDDEWQCVAWQVTKVQ